MKRNKTMTAQIQSAQIAQPHRYSHLPIPTEEQMEEIIDLMWQHRNNPQMVAKMEEVTPPHIMEALIEYSTRKADEAEARTKAIKAWAREVKILHDSVMQRLTPQQRKEVGLID